MCITTGKGSPVDHVPFEPIAIVGMACRLPGSITTPCDLWDVLVNRKSVQTPTVPESRFKIDAFYHENLNRPGSFNVRGGYFLDGSPQDFDPNFFGITPIEAMWLDPQQRRMLEVTYECLENAGKRLEDVAGESIGAFVGCYTSDYLQMLHREPDFRHEYAATGSDPGLLSARICNVFDLRGPSAAINSACSSSMTAIHQACQALQTGECDGAIAGGVNLIVSVDQHMDTAKLGILSPTSTCHTFDAAADGYGRAEGAGAIYLRRLSDALHSGEPIRAVIRGSALNTNGKVKDQGITHPSLEGQERVLRAAYKRAGLDPTDTPYVECHGTGTPVGDPIEVKAISNGMNERRSRQQPLRLGAIKANIGHSEAASGIFAVIKAALMVESGIIPGVAGFKTLNPAIKEDEWNVKINVDTRPWPESPPTRRVGVSSFGYGGTNGHLIVEAVHSDHGRLVFKPEYESSYPGKALNIEAHACIVENHRLQDLAYTLNCHRTHFSHRAFTIALEGHEIEDFSKPSFEFDVAEDPGPIAFVFTGQGAQWVGMGKDAMHNLPVFSTTINHLDQYMRTLQPPVGWTIEEALLGNIDSHHIAEPDLAQPLCTAIQIAIVDQLRTWGITPSAVVGHSSGEIAAAYAAGLLSAREAFVTSFYRGEAVAQKSPGGSMLAVGLGVDKIEPYIRGTDFVVSCENSPEIVTLSGSTSAKEKLKTQIHASGVFTRELITGRPYHSPAMEPVAESYEQLLLDASRRTDSSTASERLARVPMISSLTGSQVYESDINPKYWAENLSNRVRFHAAIVALNSLEELELNHFVEIGPHSVLGEPLKQIMSAGGISKEFKYIPSLIRGSDSCNDLLRVAGRLFLAGYAVRLQNVTNDLAREPGPQLLVDLPAYQWNYTKDYWQETRLSQEQRQQSEPRHDLLGRRVAGLSDTNHVWKNVLRLRDVPWLRDHRVGSELLLPGAAYIALAIEALWQISDTSFSPCDGVCLKDFNFQQGLVIPDNDHGIEVVTRLTRESDKGSDWYTFTVESLLDNHWTIHCGGHITARKTKLNVSSQCHQHVIKKLHQRTNPDRWYRTFDRVGVFYGNTFQRLGQVESNGRDYAAASTIGLNQKSGTIAGESRYVMHPGTIDACFQLAIISFEQGRYNVIPYSTIPMRVEEMTIAYPEETEGNAFAWTDECQRPFFRSHIQLVNSNGHPMLECKGIWFKEHEMSWSARSTAVVPDQKYMQYRWQPDIDYAAKYQGQSSYKSLEEAAHELIGLINHKRPMQRAFVAVGDDYSLLEAVTRQFPVTGKLTIAEMFDGDVKKKLKFSLPEDTSIIQFSPEIPQLSSSLQGAHDLVIFKGQLNTAIIQELQSILVPTGRMLIMQDGNTSVTSSCLDCPSIISRPALELCVSQTSLLLSQELEYEGDRQPEPTAVTLVVKESSDQRLVRECVEELQVLEVAVDVVNLHRTNHAFHQHTVILDIDGTILSNPCQTQFDMLKKLVLSEESVLLWLTLGVNQGRTAEGGLSLGFLRVVRSENPGAKILSLDVDWEESPQSIAQAMLAVLGSAAPQSSGQEMEFWLHEGILHSNRLVPWTCPSTSPKDSQAVKLPLDMPLQSEFVKSEFIFRANEKFSMDSKVDELCLQVKMTEYQGWAPDHRTKQPVIVVGHTISNDRESTLRQVVTLSAQSGYQTIVKAQKGACFEFEGLDPALLCAALPTVCKVLLCMSWLGRAQKDDHILILHMPLLFAKVAISLSKELNARITVVVATQEESEELYEASASGIPIVVVEDMHASHMSPVLEATSGKFSLVICDKFSTAGQEAWRHISAAGRFVLCNEGMEGKLDTGPFTKGASFLPMGYENLGTRQGMAAEILQDGLEFLKKNKDIWTSHVPVYSIDQMPTQSNGNQFNASPGSTGEVHAAVQFKYGESSVKILPPIQRVKYFPDAAYLLIGGLGGLGSSLVRWMAERGCRHFVFVSRSGATQPKAAQTVELAEKAGASVQVFQADAGNESDMRAIVARVMKERLIRGVVHAAMVLQDGLLEGMTAAQYQAAVTPKLRIAHVLHSILINAPLDFFVMTSSISATIGTPGQTNYSAGNSFLDAFAVYRQSLGLPACSIALPMLLDVGVVAESQTVEDSLQRLGFYGIDEVEMLEGLEVAMSPRSPSHLVLGLDPSLLHRSAGTNRLFWHGDARLRDVQRDLDLLQGSLRASKPDGEVIGDGEELDYETLMAHVGDRIVQKCASMLGREIDEINFSKGTVASYGLNSMIGSELQQWLFGEFGLALSFHAFTAPEMTFEGLTRQAVEALGAGGAK
ncbi:polyketide synthase [Aspergillus costaricaensis CBS 115574]|uniref:Polyketide synthase n=1 Tax=Aspergillus costaricaensis CBS 115574 TaxID=1448317 RepID=A0ACD1IMG9_9EURO|nr:polyketide synthase [Aspergillus costaricaensis CBS 115574]RAK91537.1 polyketide synthase [Aspergillus costaricaensis CBS 115574]